MKFIALGTSGAYPTSQLATSSYLVKTDVNLVFDMGCGVINKLQNEVAVNQINAIFLTHLHFDHISDLLTFSYMDKFPQGVKIPLIMPKSNCPQSQMIMAMSCFDVRTVDVGDLIKIGGTSIKVVKAVHAIETVGYSVESNGKKLYLTGDTMFCKEILAEAEQANTIIADCFKARLVNGEVLPHMTCMDLNYIGAMCKGKLYATHLHPTFRQDVIKESGKYEVLEQDVYYEV